MTYRFLLNKIKDILENKLDIEINDSDLEIKNNVQSSKNVFGDISTAIALKHFKNKKFETPQLYAQKISDCLQTSEIKEYIKDISVEKNSFINIFLNNKFYNENLNEILSLGCDYGKSNTGTNIKVLVEYSQPNIAKEFGVHHLRSTLIGDALVRLFQFENYETVTDTHYGDWGTQFGMIIWWIERNNHNYQEFSILDFERIYVEANKKIKEIPELRSEALSAFKRLEDKEENATKIWKTAIDISLKEFYKYCDLFNISFDYEYGESYYLDIMPSVIQECIDKGITRVEDGATLIPFEDDNGDKIMPPIFLLKSDGATTYHTRDLATIKFRNTTPELVSDKYIYQVDVAQSLHFTQLFEAARMLNWPNTQGLIHNKHGRVSLPEGKISSRKGNHPKLRKLLNLVEEKVANYYQENKKEIDQDTLKSLYVGAVKYFELKHAPVTEYVFDIDKATDLNGNTAIYIQYTYARALSILDNSELSAYIDSSTEFDILGTELSTIDIHRLLADFNNVIGKSIDSLAPHALTYYIYEICQLFNRLYNSTKFIGSDDEQYYINLTKSVSIVIENIFDILNIELPKRL